MRRLLDLNLAYLYENEADRLLSAHKSKEALASTKIAVRYAPNRPDSHTALGLLEYLNGNKEAALEELLRAKNMDADFKKRFDQTLEWTPEFRVILEDEVFLAKLFPKK